MEIIPKRGTAWVFGKIAGTALPVVLVFTMFVFGTEYSAFDGIQPLQYLFDAEKWGIATHSTTKGVLIVWVALIAIVFGIFWNTLIYQRHITGGSFLLRPSRDSNDKLKLVSVRKTTLYCSYLNILTMLICVVWIVTLYDSAHTEAWDGNENLPEAARILDPLQSSAILSVVVFGLFAIEDFLLKKSADEAVALENDDDNGYKSHWENERKYASDSLNYIDFPVIIGSILLLAYTYFTRDLEALGNGISRTGVAFLPSSQDFTDNIGNQIPMIEASTKLRALLNSPVQIGFSGGSHIMQLFISQVIFAIVTIRNALESEAK